MRVARGMTIRARLMLLAAAVFLPCAALLGAAAYLERQDALERAVDEHQAEAGRVAERLAAVVDQVRGMLVAAEALLGANLAAGAANDEALRRMLAAAPPQVAWVNLADAEGRIVASSSFGPEIRERVSIADREHFRRARESRAFVIGEPVSARFTGEPIVVLVHPISRAGGAFAGAALAVIEIARLEELVAGRGENVVALSTERGQVLLVAGRRELWGREAGSLAHFAAARGRNVFRGETRDFDGTALIGASVPVRNAPWQVFHGAPRERVLRAVHLRILAGVLLAAGTLLLGLAAATWIGRGLVREIAQLRRGVHALARGNLAHRIAAPGSGEFGDLAADVNRMAEALGAADARLRSLVALSTDFFWEADPELRFTRLEGNTGGTPPEQARGRRFWDLGYRLNGDPAFYRGILERREPFRDVELVREDPSGGIVQVLHVSGEPVFGQAGEFLGYRGVGRDLTERNRLEAEVRRAQGTLAASEARYRSVAEISSDWVWETDREHRFTWFSGGLERATGIRPSELIGRRCWELPASNLGEADRAAHRARLDARLPFDDFRLEGFRSDGRRVVHSISGRPVAGPSGEFLGYRGVGHDITAQVEAEEALRAEGERLARVLETMVEGLAILDAEGRYVLFNAAAERIVGAPRAEVLGRHFAETPWRRLPVEGDHAALPQAVFERLRSGAERTVGPTTYAIERADGARRILSHRAARLEDASGAFAGVVATFEDITERIAAEEEHRREILALHADLERRVEERTAELAQAYREMEAFSYSVSHDLRAPLRAISGFARIALEDFRGEIPAEASRLLARVAQNAERMGALIDGLLEFSRLSRQPLRLARIRPADLVREVLEELAALREGRCIEIRVGDMPECEADRVLLKQVYANLIANAIKYTARCTEARVEVGSITMGLGPVYYVRDNGVGFDMTHAAKLFEMFQRLHRPAEFEGNGIGLALVRRIVERHGGRVWADSAPGKGATFFFRLGGEAPGAREGARAAA